jgi:2-methylcitrate dehydratase PrpD
MNPIADTLARYIAETDFDRLPREVVDETKKFILDTIGVGLAGVREPGCREVVDLVKTWSSNPAGSTIILCFMLISEFQTFFIDIAFIY